MSPDLYDYKISNRSTEAIGGLKAPTTSTELISFLGLSNVFRSFSQIFAHIAVLLNSMFKKG